MFSWNAGVVYKIRPNGTIFVGAGKSFNPAGEDLSTNYWDDEQNLKPEESIGTEIGTKWELFNQKLFLSAALFKTVKDKVRTDDPLRSASTRNNSDPNTRWDAYANVNGGKQEVKGLELTAFGEVTPKLSIAGGYTYQKSKVKKSTGDDIVTVGEELARTPKHSFTVWASYDVTPKLATGLGVQYVSSQWNSTYPKYREKAPSYHVFDAMAKYTVTDNVMLRFNADNIFDERYVGTVGGGHFIPGKGRYFSVGVDYAL